MAEIKGKMRTCVIKGRCHEDLTWGEHDNAIAEAIAGRIEPKPELVKVTPPASRRCSGVYFRIARHILGRPLERAKVRPGIRKPAIRGGTKEGSHKIIDYMCCDERPI
jgi:hypothetical protein